jgi:DNA-binding MarR family transcriptional regulator
MPLHYVIEESLGFLTGQYSRLALKRVAESFVRNGLGITSAQWTILVRLWSQDGITQQTIAQKISKDKARTARLVGSIEKLGLIYRVTGDGDSREKRVYLTEKGKEVIGRAAMLVQEVLQDSYQGIDSDDLRTCRKVLLQAYLNLE